MLGGQKKKKMLNKHFTPVTVTQNAAPDEVLKLKICAYKKTYGKKCTFKYTTLCSKMSSTLWWNRVSNLRDNASKNTEVIDKMEILDLNLNI